MWRTALSTRLMSGEKRREEEEAKEKKERKKYSSLARHISLCCVEGGEEKKKYISLHITDKHKPSFVVYHDFSETGKRKRRPMNK